MKHLKMLGLFAMAAVSLMAFAGSASASNPEFTSTGTEYTGTLDASAKESLLLEASVLEATCTESTVHGTITENTNGVARGPLTLGTGGLSFGNCGGATVHTIASGELEVITGGEVKAKGNQVTVKVGSSPTCVYGGGTGTKIGTLSGTSQTLVISANLPKQPGSNFLCPATAKWSGAYVITTPHDVFVH